MSTKSDGVGESLAYFSDGHIEKIVDFEISKDGHDVWFTVESGRWFVYKEELVRSSNGYFYPTYAFCKIWINRDRDGFGTTCDVEHLVTDEIYKIRLYMPE